MKKLLDIKFLLMVVLVLNSLDGILTYYGLVNHWIEEANPLLSSFSPLTILIIKMMLSLAVFFLWKSNFPTRFMMGWRLILLFVILLYSWIMLLHVVWIVLT